jgi:hypothetical protein
VVGHLSGKAENASTESVSTESASTKLCIGEVK